MTIDQKIERIANRGFQKHAEKLDRQLQKAHVCGGRAFTASKCETKWL